MPLDDEAVAEIYREHGPMLRRVVWRATSDPNRVEDIVQEVILRVWRQAPEADNLRAYLITTARHLIVDQHRAGCRRTTATSCAASTTNGCRWPRRRVGWGCPRAP